MSEEIRSNGRIDYRINEIEAEVVGLKVAVNAIDEKIERQTQVITDLVKSERTNPGVQIAFATLLLAVVIFYNRLTIEPVLQTLTANKVSTDDQITMLEDALYYAVEGNEKKINELKGYLKAHKDSEGHTATIIKVAKLEEAKDKGK